MPSAPGPPRPAGPFGGIWGSDCDVGIVGPVPGPDKESCFCGDSSG